MKREFDTIRVDRDTAHARRVNRTDSRGIGHPTLSLGSLRQSVVWGVCGVPSHSRNIYYYIAVAVWGPFFFVGVVAYRCACSVPALTRADLAGAVAPHSLSQHAVRTALPGPRQPTPGVAYHESNSERGCVPCGGARVCGGIVRATLRPGPPCTCQPSHQARST